MVRNTETEYNPTQPCQSTPYQNIHLWIQQPIQRMIEQTVDRPMSSIIQGDKAPSEGAK
jgi:hypothetical protein